MIESKGINVRANSRFLGVWDVFDSWGAGGGCECGCGLAVGIIRRVEE